MIDEDDEQGSFRWDDGSTARGGAKVVRVSRRRQQTVYAVASRGARGANWTEITQLLNLDTDQRQSLSPRLKKLREDGLLELHYEMIDGERCEICRPGWTGVKQWVHFATPAGMAYARVIDPVKLKPLALETRVMLPLTKEESLLLLSCLNDERLASVRSRLAKAMKRFGIMK